MSDAQKLIADVHHYHQWRGEVLGCGCGWNWPEERTYFCGEEDRISKAHSAHVAAEIDKALGALKPEYIARHESGGGTIHGTLVNAEIAMHSYVVRDPGVEDPGSGMLARTETAWFVETVWERASAVLFLHGRLHFHRPDGARAVANAGAPSCLVAYGMGDAQRLATTGIPGTLWIPRGGLAAQLRKAAS